MQSVGLFFIFYFLLTTIIFIFTVEFKFSYFNQNHKKDFKVLV